MVAIPPNCKRLQIANDLGVSDADTFVADLGDLAQVYDMAKDIQTKHSRLDVLVNNAGILKAPNSDKCTQDGVDLRFAVNTIAPHVLTKQLLPILSKHGRVINVASAGQAPVDLDKAFPKHQRQTGAPSPRPSSPYSSQDFDAYCQSKLALIQWTNVLAEQNPDRVIASLNPASMIGTKMVKESFGVDGKSLQIGADILATAAVGESFVNASGKYFDNDKGDFGSPHPDAMSAAKCRLFVERMDEWLTTSQQPDLN
jgi:NAD(P)-dependent dehydrogenase (short-subunit alcohol dehydrogenase family)